jgi:hypothetical protein
VEPLDERAIRSSFVNCSKLERAMKHLDAFVSRVAAG